MKKNKIINKIIQRILDHYNIIIIIVCNFADVLAYKHVIDRKTLSIIDCTP
jgi:glutamate racemase